MPNISPLVVKQWGTFVPTEAGITFPIKFTSFSYVLLHVRKNDTNYTLHTILLNVYLTGFECALGQYALVGHYPTNMDIDYIAIGK